MIQERQIVAGSADAGRYRGYMHADHCREPCFAGSRMIEIPGGPIEYGLRGSGIPLLAVHGAGGGYDQGLALAETFAGEGFRVIAPSRFGYLRTPLPPDASLEAQAAAYAYLLDAVRVHRAVVVGYSAGAPSALQFAMQYPDRIAALVLLAPGLFVPPVVPSALPHRLYGAFTTIGIPVWLAMRADPFGIVTWLRAALQDVHTRLPRANRSRLGRIVQAILPARARSAGMIADAHAMRFRKRFPLERIGVPTLVVSARDDLYATYPAAEYTARTMPNARFIGFDRGGHRLTDHEGEIRSAVADLVRGTSSS